MLPDGYCVLLISLGSSLASSQVPSDAWIDSLWVKSAEIYNRISSRYTLIYITGLKLLLVARFFYYRSIDDLLDKFYNATIKNFKS